MNPLIRAGSHPRRASFPNWPIISGQFRAQSIMNEDREIIGDLPEGEYLRQFLAAAGVAD